MAKTLLIGWDAADWQLINPLIEKGLMPTFAKLKSNGVFGNLATLKPVLSPVLWTSIATGKRSYKHGIHGFVEINPATANIEAVKVTSRKCAAIWNILNTAGLKTNVVNWWPSHPAEAVNGVYVSNRFHIGAPALGKPWPLAANTVHPQEWQTRLEDLRLHPAELTLAHIEPFIKAAANLNPENDGVLKSVIRVLAHACSIHNAATELMVKTDWDFMAVYQEAIDHFSHLAMKYHPPKLKDIADADFEKYSGIVEAAYRFHDMMLERLLELAGADTNVLLVSDHGFQNGAQRTVELPDVPAAPALEHRKFGVFLAHGPAFKKNKEVFGASLLDVAPSILHAHGLPVGDDMEGKVLHQMFNTQIKPSTITTWEDVVSLQKNTLQENSSHESDAAVLRQLAEIGYIDLPEKEKQAYVRYELEYNLIQSLVDGGQWTEAQRKGLQLYNEFKDGRSTKILLHILHQIANTKRFEAILNAFKTLVGAQHPDVIYFTGLQYNMHGNYAKALEYFITLEDAGGLSVQLYVQIANSFYLAQKYEQAERYVQKALKLEEENPAALSFLGQTQIALQKFEKAIDTLTRSVALQFFQPTAHYFLALAFIEINALDAAKKALESCLHQAPKHTAARHLFNELMHLKPMETQPIIVVSGLPRSGTSMLMQMLQLGEVSLYTDKKREADAHNPKGYFETEAVKRLPQSADFLKQAKGKAVKIVSPLLRYLPADNTYYILLVERPMLEVLISQEKMKGRTHEEIMRSFPFKLAVDFEEEQKRIFQWLDQQLNIKYITVKYLDCLENPTVVAQQIANFLPLKFNPELAVSAINKKLHRNKLS